MHPSNEVTAATFGTLEVGQRLLVLDRFDRTGRWNKVEVVGRRNEECWWVKDVAMLDLGIDHEPRTFWIDDLAEWATVRVAPEQE